MMSINVIKSLIFILTIIICAWTGLVFALSPAIPLIFFNRQWYFRWCSFIMGSFLLMFICFLEDFFHIKIIVTGDDLTSDKKRSIILLNHRTRLDWMYIWILHGRFQILNQLKIVLKAQLKHLPGLGWAIQHAGYLFLKRRWDDDKEIMKNAINYYKHSQSPLSLLIFPEGTDFNEGSKKKSNNYAAKQTTYNRPYDYCLHPRVTGFTYLVNIMRADDMIDAIDDVTIAYKGNFPKREIDVLKGILPEVVYFHIKRYNINEIPMKNEKIDEWLQQCWDEKEDRLKEFYSKIDSNFSDKFLNNKQIESHVRYNRRCALIFWIIYTLFWTYCFIKFIQIKFYVLLVCIFHIVMEIFANGIIDFVCQFHANSQKRIVKQD